MAKPKIRSWPDLSDLAKSGLDIAVRVKPNAARDAVHRQGDVLVVSVTAVPENGKANAAVQKLLAIALGLAPSRLELKRGHTSRQKVFVIRD